MIERYSTKDMKRILSDKNKFKTWENVEIAVAEVMKDKGIVPAKSLEVIKLNFFFVHFLPCSVFSFQNTNNNFCQLFAV